MLGSYNLITLAALGYIDLKKFKIPNVILAGWLVTIIIENIISTTPITQSSIISSFATVGIYYPLRQAVKCSAGDFKLYAVMMLTDTPHNILIVCLISMFLSLIPMVCGLKKIPIAFMTLFGYIAFLLIC